MQRPGSTRVCRHFLANSCLRRDCAFSHDLSAVPCRFWGSIGGCGRGQNCPFLHDVGTGKDVRALGKATPAWSSEYDIDLDWMVAHAQRLGLDEAESASENSAGAQINVDDEEAFPALPNSKPRPSSAKPTGAGAGAAPAPTLATTPPSMPLFAPSSSPFFFAPRPPPDTNTLAAKLIIQSLASSFPMLSREEIEQYYRRAGTLDSTIALIQSSTGHAPARTPAPSKPVAKPAGGSAPAARERREAIARAIARALSWVQTGDSVAALYETHRSEAAALARARNAAFDKATKAYLSGDGASAAAFSRQAREFDGRMKEAHVKAAAAIFEARNRGVGGSGQLSVEAPGGVMVPVEVFDLHGLHPSEATEVAGEVLSQRWLAQSEQQQRADATGVWVAFLTGTRHHSQKLGKGGGSLHERLRSFVKEEAYELYEPDAGAGKSTATTSGILVVRL